MTALAIQPFEPFYTSGVSESSLRVCKQFREIQRDQLGRTVFKLLFGRLEDAVNEARTEDWDGYGALSISQGSVDNAYRFLQLLPSRYFWLEVSIDPDGEVCLDWYKTKSQLISISVGSDGALHYIAFSGRNRMKGVEHFDWQMPPYIMEVFNRVFP